MYVVFFWFWAQCIVSKCLDLSYTATETRQRVEATIGCSTCLTRALTGVCARFLSTFPSASTLTQVLPSLPAALFCSVHVLFCSVLFVRPANTKQRRAATASLGLSPTTERRVATPVAVRFAEESAAPDSAPPPSAPRTAVPPSELTVAGDRVIEVCF